MAVAWKDREALHQPEWPDTARLDEVKRKLHALPPLVFAGEARQVRGALAEVAAGRAFLLQAGDCAESFHDYERLTDTAPPMPRSRSVSGCRSSCKWPQF